MFSFLAKKTATTAHINGTPITVLPKETVLQAALRQHIDFPHSCRVGGCATCKCRLLDGRVKELTSTGYVLSDQELDQGYILACQSVPQTDISIAVNLEAAQARRQVSGRIVGQERLTHDITQLRIQLDESLDYKAGQFANLSLATLGDATRSYSFATPVQPDSQVCFFIRKVPGGAMSTLVNERSVLGERVRVDGPYGDFWLRPAEAPLMLVAGGSGLAPVLALLRDAADKGVARPVTLLFGAQRQRDLYALDDIAALARRWRGRFEFIPVLSAAAEDTAWQGARGMVDSHIAASLTEGSHAYLCGPPPMVDACAAQLHRCGVQADQIHADRFITNGRNV
jgi:3-phenylpropionate/trans-cinnamate dioxygenase ferredoxin reductase subunit